jgi:UDP-glucose 4-epimerase
MSSTILVTGGLGYIGSHTTVELIENGFTVILVDNFSNSEPFILDRIEQITGTRPLFYQNDLCDMNAVRKIFSENNIDVVIHFAAYKSIGESVKEPLKYFHNNLQSLVNVLEAMQEKNVKHIVFSSSATVYGEPDQLPVTEMAPFKKALSAYGSTKQMGEDILEKIGDTGVIQNISLRYFNPVGAHVSALIGELPKGIPNNLFPFVTQTAIGKIKQLTVFGDDYNTADGSCIRDYIHVVDLAKAHVQACKRLIEQKAKANFEVFNIGTGKGTSVLEMIHSFENITGVRLNYTIGSRREGDAPAVFASTSKANELLNWKAELDLGKMITTAWNWQLRLNHLS